MTNGAAEGSSDTEADASAETADATTVPDDVEMGVFETIVDEVEVMTGTVLGQPLDTNTGINRVEDGWAVTVQVIERKSIPDTQDILGQYELTFDDSISPVGYERTARYRRDQMNERI